MGQDYTVLPPTASKQQKYLNVLLALQQRMQKSAHPIANRCNLLAILKEQFNWWWIGFYFVYANKYGIDHTQKYKLENQQQFAKKINKYLSLGSFQGPPACTQIFQGFGVCGKSWQTSSTIIVADVSKFPGHISCSSKSKSQIVVPIFNNQQFIGVLDVDSSELDTFCETDKNYLQKIMRIFQKQGLFCDWIK